MNGAPHVFSCGLKIGPNLRKTAVFKTEDRKTSYQDLKICRQHYFVIFYPRYLIIWRQLISIWKFKYDFMCKEPHKCYGHPYLAINSRYKMATLVAGIYLPLFPTTGSMNLSITGKQLLKSWHHVTVCFIFNIKQVTFLSWLKWWLKTLLFWSVTVQCSWLVSCNNNSTKRWGNSMITLFL